VAGPRADPNSWDLSDDYEVLSRLGEGTFGKVYKARLRATGDLVAVKQIKLGSRSWQEACQSTELQALRSLRHPYIVRLRELLRNQRDGSLYYVFEFIDSDLCWLMKENADGLEESRAAELARQLFAGIAHMHQHGFFHRDLKPENVLLESTKETIRVADLGQARSLRARPPFTDYVGTRWYRAPECLLRDRGYSSPVDVWASGLIFAELMRGSPLFCGTSTVDQLFKIFSVLGQGQALADWPEFAKLANALRFKVPQQVGCGLGQMVPRASPQAVSVITEILNLNPRRRILAKRVLEHPYFAQLAGEMQLDTHRSHVSSVPADDDGKRDEEPLTSARQEPSHFTAVAADTTSDLVDLDAELDAILGDSRNDAVDRAPPHQASAVLDVTVHSNATFRNEDARHPCNDPMHDQKTLAVCTTSTANPLRADEFLNGTEGEARPMELQQDDGSQTSAASSAISRAFRRQARWKEEELAQLRRSVRRVLRQGNKRQEAMWREVSRCLNFRRSPEECQRQYSKDYRSGKAPDLCPRVLDVEPFMMSFGDWAREGLERRRTTTFSVNSELEIFDSRRHYEASDTSRPSISLVV
jgi:serine/threonine protein kinase